MNTAKKISDENSTAEFELPESFKKKADELKTENQNLVNEINQAKTEQTQRKQDESTNVFELRQYQLNEKIKALEERKKKTEKELAIILQKKNAAFHSDLKWATELLVSESKKIVPLEKEIESGVSKINNIKNEMQILFENSIEARKKEGEAINEQSKEIHELGHSLKEILNTLRVDQKEFQKNISKMNEELMVLHHTKSELTTKVFQLREEQVQLEGLKSEIGLKKEELKKIEDELNSAKQKLAELNEALPRKSSLQKEIEILNGNKLNLEQEVKKLQFDKEEIVQYTLRLDYSLKEVEEQLASKRKLLMRIEEETLEVKKDLEKTRREHLELQRASNRELQGLAQVQAEVSRLEGQKSTTIKIQAETIALYEEKREFYLREISRLEDDHQHRVNELREAYEKKQLGLELEFAKYTEDLHLKEADMRRQFELKQEAWEEDFKVYCDKRHDEMLRSLESTNAEDLKKIKTIKKDMTEELINILETQLTRTGFASSQEKMDEARVEMKKTFDKYFGRTLRWKWW